MEDYDVHYRPRKHSLSSPISKTAKFSFPPSPTVILKPGSPECMMVHGGMGSPTPGRRQSLSAITSGSGLKSSFSLQVPVDVRWHMSNVQEQHDEGIFLESTEGILMNAPGQSNPYTESSPSAPAKSKPVVPDYLAHPVIVPPIIVNNAEVNNRRRSSSRSSGRGSPSSDISTLADEKSILRVPSGSSLAEGSGMHSETDNSVLLSPITSVQQKGTTCKRLRKRECGRHSPRQKVSKSKINSPTILSPLPSHRSDKGLHQRRNSPKFFFPRQSSSTDSASSTTDDNQFSEAKPSHSFRKVSSVTSFPECVCRQGSSGWLSPNQRSANFKENMEYSDSNPVSLTVPILATRLQVPTTTAGPTLQSANSIPQHCSQRR